MTTSAWYENLAEPIKRVLDKILEFLPSLLGAVTLLLLGWVLARVLRIVGRRLTLYGLKRLGHTRSFETGLELNARYRGLPEVVGRLIFWIVLLFFVAAAIEALGLQAVTDLLSATTTYLPRILVATVIIFAAVLGGDFARRSTTNAAARAGLAFADSLGRTVQVGLMVLAVMIAIDQLGIASSVLMITLAIVLGSVLGAAALAFGIGSAPTVSNIVAAHYVRMSYEVGNSVQVGDLQGSIAEIERTAVVLDTPQGRVQVPARRFTEEVSVLLRSGD